MQLLRWAPSLSKVQLIKMSIALGSQNPSNAILSEQALPGYRQSWNRVRRSREFVGQSSKFFDSNLESYVTCNNLVTQPPWAWPPVSFVESVLAIAQYQALCAKIRGLWILGLDRQGPNPHTNFEGKFILTVRGRAGKKMSTINRMPSF